ncbi:hypothetical protein [Infirmifilum sp. SLHALR2]
MGQPWIAKIPALRCLPCPLWDPPGRGYSKILAVRCPRRATPRPVKDDGDFKGGRWGRKEVLSLEAY